MSDWDLEKYARIQRYSQCGEEGIIEQIFSLIGTTNRVAVEFGCADGYNLSNTRALLEQGWTVHMWDCAYANHQVRRHLITAENVNEIFQSEGVPEEFDLLSIDIDGNDYWVWKALTACRPRVVVIEFNGALSGKKTIPYDPAHRHDGTDYYGASFELLCALGREKGYVPVCQIADLNLFFVRKELVPVDPDTLPLFHAPRPSHPPDLKERPWLVFG